MSSTSSSPSLRHHTPPLTDLTSFTSASTTSSAYIENWIEHTQASNLPLSKSLKKRNRSLSPITASSSVCEPRAKRRRKSFGDQECTITASIMSDQPTTPKGKAPATAPGPITPSGSYPSYTTTPTNLSKLVKNVTWIGRRMDENDVIEDAEGDIAGYPVIIAIINDILNNPRGSEMKPRSAERIQAAHRFYKNNNEDTILNELLPLISKGEYMKLWVPEAGGEGQVTQAGEEQYVLEDWFEAGVATATNRDFLDAYMPSRYDGGELHKDLVQKLKKDDKMTTPRPDRCMGIRGEKFPCPKNGRLDMRMQEAIHICPDMDHPFFIIEGKSNRGHMGEADNQARRGGAVLVNANRALRVMAGEPESDGADPTTVAFSATMDAYMIHLHIHWAEAQKGRVIFHKTLFTGASFGIVRQQAALRQAFNNIKEWGAVGRMPELLRLREKLYQVSAVRLKELDAEVREVAKDKEDRKRKRASASSP